MKIPLIKTSSAKPIDLLQGPAQKVKAPKVTRADKVARANARAAERSRDVSTSDGTGTKRPGITIVGKKSPVDDVAETLEDLASMLEAGESEDRAVQQLAKQYGKYNIGMAYKRVGARMINGTTIIEALNAETDVLPRVARELIAAGSTPRDLHSNLRQAARIIVASSDVKAKVRSALFKPLLTLGIVIVFILGAAEWLLPSVVDMFTSIGSDAPQATVIMIAVGGSLKWVLGGVAALVLLWMGYWIFSGRKNQKLRVIRDRFSLNAPLIGPITKMGVAGRFTDVLAACLSSGMTELDALEIAGRSCGNEAIEAHVREHIVRQRVGEAVFGDVARTELFPWNLSHRIDIAPSPRQRIEVMRDLAKVFNKKSDRRLNAFVDKVGPLTEIVVLIAAAVVILMVAIPVTTFAPALMNLAG
jgi:type II secretory pathway component PulF